MPATTEHCIMCWVCVGYDVVGVMSLCRSVGVCVCVCLAPMQLSIIINFTSKCRPQTWQTVLPLLLLLLPLADKQIISTTGGGAKSLRHDIFPSLSPLFLSLSLSLLLSVVSALHFSSSISSYKLQVASCQLQINQSDSLTGRQTHLFVRHLTN